jgi:hypothetical protein
MHYHCEIILPNPHLNETTDMQDYIQSNVSRIMRTLLSLVFNLASKNFHHQAKFPKLIPNGMKCFLN